MASIRRAAWFVATALAMAVWMGALGSFRGEAVAGVIASRGSDGGARAADLEKVRAVLESKVVQQRLVDYGVSPADAMAKVRAMSERDLHRLASLSDRAAAGADIDVLGTMIGIAILVILIIIIVKLMNKEVIIR